MPAPRFTVTLRSANPARTRCDAVVVGLMSTTKGVVVAEGGEDVAKAYGRKLRPLLVTMGATGKAGEVLRVPGGDATSAGLVVFVGLGTLVRCLGGGGGDGRNRRA